MTAFSGYDWLIALVMGGLVGVAIVATATAQAKNADALEALQQGMGTLYTLLLFVIGAFPIAAMFLLGSLRSAPTALDSLAMIVMIGLPVIASLTLHGNVVKVLRKP